MIVVSMGEIMAHNATMTEIVIEISILGINKAPFILLGVSGTCRYSIGDITRNDKKKCRKTQKTLKSL